MSEAEKPHEHDHAPHDDATPDHAPHADPHPQPEATAQAMTEETSDHHADPQAHVEASEPAAASAQVEPEGHADGAPAADADADAEAGAAEPQAAHHPEAEAAPHDAGGVEDAHPTPAHEPVPVPPAEPMAAAAVAGATAAAASRVDAASPIWSDHGDAPDHAAAPVYKPRKEKKSKASSGGSGNEFVEILKTVFFALLIAVILRIVLFQPFTIPSASMEPNLYEGDYIVVSKWSYGYSKHAIPFSPALFEGRIMGKAPQRGDIAVFKLPRDDSTDYIKRVIGLPGDRIQMIDGILHINNTPVKRERIADYVAQDNWGRSRPVMHYRETLPNGVSHEIIENEGDTGTFDNTAVFAVPAGHFFMMGDNRDNSLDSRDRSVGYVPFENFVGRAEIIFFSIEDGASAWRIWEWPWTVRWGRLFSGIK